MRPEPNWVQDMAINPTWFRGALHSIMKERAESRSARREPENLLPPGPSIFGAYVHLCSCEVKTFNFFKVFHESF
jgi:hypothetical protein